MPFAKGTAGARIHYDVYGDAGPWVVLVMGLGASSRLWLDIPQRLQSERYRVLTVDNRGTGGSDPLRGPYSLGRMADDVIRAMDAASVDRGYLVGMSMGGMIAQHAALRHAHRLAGLVLLATTPGLPHAPLPTPRAMRGLLLSALGARLGEAAGHKLVADLILSPSDAGRAVEITDAIGPAFLAAPTPARSFLWQLAACMVHSTGRHLRRIATPTVVVAGSDDIIMHPKNARVLAERIPNAVLQIVPDCGHGISFSHPDVVHWALAYLTGGGPARQSDAPSSPRLRRSG
jgi:pimeloyl-ACP methyl ester carboxylesterase